MLSIVKRALGRILNIVFFSKPHRGVKLFYLLGIDIPLYTFPLFWFDNRRAFKKLKSLRKAGLNPAIVYHVKEGDGRFDRFNEISRPENDVVVFTFAPRNVLVEVFYFWSYAQIPIGFYDDARQKYRQDTNWENRVRYRGYCHRLFDYLEKYTGHIDVFCSGSNNDRWIVEMIYVAQERGTTWVVAEREGTGTDFTYKHEAECFRQSESIQAHYIFAANDKHRDCFIHAKTATVKQVKTLGELDTDWWFHWDKKFVHPKYSQWNKFEKKILFLTFGARNYIEPYLYPNRPELTWLPLMQDCEETLIKYAQKYPNVLVFYKMGHLEDYNAAFLNECQRLGLSNVVPLDRQFPCNELILYCDLVIGFQTTAMFEAMFSKAPLVQLSWGIPNTIEPETQLLPINKYGAVIEVKSKQDLYEVMDAVVTNPHHPSLQVTADALEKRKRTREIMFWNSDGKVAERFLGEIRQILKDRVSA